MANVLRAVSQVFGRKDSDGPRSYVQPQHMHNIPNNNNPSHNQPIPFPTSPIPDVPRNILAFCTITKLLSQIQQERVFQVSHSETKRLPPEERLELKLSNAFSTIAVTDHEVVAVVTECTPETLNVIACAQTSINEFQITPSLPS